MATKIQGRLQTPSNDQGERDDLHLINTTDEVIVDYGGEKARPLTTKLNEMRPVVSKSQPSHSDRGESDDHKSSYLWAQIVTDGKAAITPATGKTRMATILDNLSARPSSPVNTSVS